MPEYKGQPCTSCRNVFKEGDEIVVCPECGSPYHKACYKLEGKCINTLLHESGGEWHPEPVVLPHAETIDNVCPNCGSHNPPGAFFCTGCGVSLQSDRPERPVPETPSQPYFNPASMPFPTVNVKTVSESDEVDTNTVGEYSKYVGSKAYYYIPKFFRFAKTGSKVSFSLPAFFFPQIWFFYRKMIPQGIVALLASVIVAIPSVIEYLTAYATGTVPTQLYSNSAFMMLSLICSVLSWVLYLVCGVFGNWFYYKKAKADIDKIKASEPDVYRRSQKIESAGGTSFGYVAAAVGVMFVISFILVFGLTAGGSVPFMN